MIKVRLFTVLAEKSRLRKKDFEIPLDGSLKVLDIVQKELPAGWDEHIMAIVNGFHVELDHEVKDGDQVEIMLAIAGGCA